MRAIIYKRSKLLSLRVETQELALRALKNLRKPKLTNCDSLDSLLLKILYSNMFLNLLFESTLLSNTLFDSRSFDDANWEKDKEEEKRLCKRLDRRANCNNIEDNKDKRIET